MKRIVNIRGGFFNDEDDRPSVNRRRIVRDYAQGHLDELCTVVNRISGVDLPVPFIDVAARQALEPRIHRSWAMPNSDTFTIKPIAELLHRYIKKDDIVIDPFARNATLGTWTNDMNPSTGAQYHMHAENFCKMLAQEGVAAKLALFDPPYSAHQAKECYEGFGHRLSQREAQVLFARVKDELSKLLRVGGIAISFGWNSTGFGKKRGFEQLEVLLVCHGRCHNDTIVTVERKLARDRDLFLEEVRALGN